MFSGIVACTGRITHIAANVAGVRLTVHTGSLDTDDVAMGDSIAVSGVCLTVVARNGSELQFDVSRETLDCTAGLSAVGVVNLEKALRLNDVLGGHLVTGHVDGVGEVLRFESAGESCELVVRAPQELARYIARKGSITVDGVSLTINRVEASEFSINLIPHTLQATTLQRLQPGSRVNLEVRPDRALCRADAGCESRSLAMNTLAPIKDIVADIRAGRMVILVDEEERENEGDLVLACRVRQRRRRSISWPSMGAG